MVDEKGYIKDAWFDGWRSYWCSWTESQTASSGHQRMREHKRAGWLAAQEFAAEAEHRAEKYAQEIVIERNT
jgi:hypothetical protein